ncbi:MAG: hypothetical protein D1H97_13545 [Paracoccus sp. BP8]|nr:MAG: hypothetical protein D1H97_13545 [Paracoccus sp. BP8]
MVKGIAEMQAMFRRRAAKAVAAGKAQAQASGDQVASAMRYLAPREDGALIRSIRVEDAETIATSRGERGFIGVVVKAGDDTTIVTSHTGARFQNAKLQEHGTKNMAANPYFNPAWRANRARVRSAISRAIRKAWASG